MGLEGRIMEAQEILQEVVENDLSVWKIGDRKVVGLIGSERPSTYSKSPDMWNSLFRRLGMSDKYIYVPLDVSDLWKFVEVARKAEMLIGFNVTVNHKKGVISHLDGIAPDAKQIEAVNTVLLRDGKFYGYNTDGIGEILNLTVSKPLMEKPFVDSLEGKSVLILGAGGAGDAVSFAIASKLGSKGEMYIANRTAEKAQRLAEKIKAVYGIRVGWRGDDIRSVSNFLAMGVDLIVNTSLKGNKGPLEGYSALVPADPARGEEGIRENNSASLALLNTLPKGVLVADIIYSPEETVFLRQARETGHKTQNGKGMLLYQGVAGAKLILGELVEGLSDEQIAEPMYKGLIGQSY